MRSYERFFWAAIASAIACFADNENRANVAIVTVTIVFFFYFPKRVKAVVAIYIAAAGVSNIDHGLPLPDELTNVAKWFYLVPPCVVVWIPIVAPMVVLSEGAYANYLKSLGALPGHGCELASHCSCFRIRCAACVCTFTQFLKPMPKFTNRRHTIGSQTGWP